MKRSEQESKRARQQEETGRLIPAKQRSRGEYREEVLAGPVSPDSSAVWRGASPEKCERQTMTTGGASLKKSTLVEDGRRRSYEGAAMCLVSRPRE